MDELRVRVPKELRDWLEEESKRMGLTVTALVVVALWERKERSYSGVIEEKKRRISGVTAAKDISPTQAKTDAEREGPDPRHGLMRELILQRHRETFGVECEWGAPEAGQLTLLLRTNPKWGLTDMKRMVENRFVSEGVTSERPMVWLKDLGMYAAGPLDRFKKVMTAGGGSDGRGQEGARRVSPSEQRADDIKRSIINAFTDPIGEAAKPDGAQRKSETRGRLIEGIPKTV